MKFHSIFLYLEYSDMVLFNNVLINGLMGLIHLFIRLIDYKSNMNYIWLCIFPQMPEYPNASKRLQYSTGAHEYFEYKKIHKHIMFHTWIRCTIVHCFEFRSGGVKLLLLSMEQCMFFIIVFNHGLIIFCVKILILRFSPQ